MECVFYDSRIQKQVPCLIQADYLFDVTNNFGTFYYVKTSFDSSRYSTFKTNRDELLRFSQETVLINDIYPTTNSTQSDYADYVLPKKYARTTTPYLTTSTHSTDELDRFESIVEMITNVVGEISPQTYYNLIVFIMYELYGNYCDSTDRAFLDSLSASQLSSQPGTIYVPQMIRMLKQVFSKFSGTDVDGYKIINYKNISEFDSLFPIIISLTNLRYNVNYIILP